MTGAASSAGSSADARPPRLEETRAGVTLHWRGVDFYPGPDPAEYARRKARFFSIAPRTLVFVPSLGLGYGLAELLRAMPSDAEVLCVEAFQEIMAVGRGGIPPDPRLHVVRTDGEETVAQILRELGAGRFRRVREVPLCAGYRLAPGLYTRLRTRLERDIMLFWQNRLTMIALGSLQLRNVVSNLPLLEEAFDFTALSTALPVVVAGAGPSLEQSLPSLAEHRGRFALLAVDTALAPLRGAGLAPDLVVALEAQVINNQDFIPAPPPATWLACDLSVHPAAARLFPGRQFFFSSQFAPLRLWERMARCGLRPLPFPALGSVGVTAVHAALTLTQGTVFLTGLDFSFPGRHTHTRGSPFALSLLSRCVRLEPAAQETFRSLEARRLVRRTDKHGGTVLTDRVMSSYRDGLAALLHGCAGRVYDLGETGLPLGVRPISAAEFSALLPAGGGGERLGVRGDRRFSGAALRPFLAAERALLKEFLQAPSGAGLADIDYVWAHFPDEPDLSSPGGERERGFLARAAVAARYYDQRLQRVEARLPGAGAA